MGTPRFHDVIERYLQNLQAAGRSPWTVRGRRCALSGLACFANSDDLRHVCCAIPAYLSAEFDRLDHNSVRLKWWTLHHFCAWCAKHGWLKTRDNPFETLPPPLLHLKIVRPLTDAQLYRLFEVGDRWDRAILTILLSTGMRIGELASLSWRDMDGDVLRIYGKGGKERLVGLGLAGVRALAELPHNGYHVFPFKLSSIEDRFCRLSKRSGVHVHAHLLRHTWADRMRQAGVSVEDIALLLGHSSTTITMHYLGREQERALEAQRRLNPADALLGDTPRPGKVVPFKR